jgi:hypothetical protein
LQEFRSTEYPEGAAPPYPELLQLLNFCNSWFNVLRPDLRGWVTGRVF